MTALLSAGQLFNNRAACHLMLGNVRAALRDSAAAIHTCMQESQLSVRVALADTFLKASARMSRALEMVGKCGVAGCERRVHGE